mgnify:CR=1 FL=1
MFKFIILFFVVLWAAGLFLGKKRRIIKDTQHLLNLFLWVAIAFAGLTTLSGIRPLGDSILLRILVSGIWLALSWFIARFLTRLISR